METQHEVQTGGLKNQVVINSKTRHARRYSADTTLLDAKTADVTRDELKLELIIQELNVLVKESEKAKKATQVRQQEHGRLRTMAMNLMEEGTEFRTKLGVLTYRTSMVNRRLSKDRLEEELVRRNFSKEDVKIIIKASTNEVQVRNHVAFSLKKK